MMTAKNGPHQSDRRDDSFRDSLGIVSAEGKRKWVYPKRIVGRFYRWRTAVSVILLAALCGLPFVRFEGHPYFLFDVVGRKFILFGSIFGPHDYYLFGLALITLVVSIILFTVVFGRLFCGWVCPQTVFMEMVFRRIDYWVEGDEKEQRRLDESSWNAAKLARKGTKYVVYFCLSFVIGNLLLAYVIGVDELFRIISDPPSRHPAGLTAMLGFTGLFYWIFIWFREQACILVCPYGRLQGVLLDPHSIVIAYDYIRGEPRGRLHRNTPRAKGDCIDCSQCVEVCPTGIDIRNGTQLECVNCAACIDACDYVMGKIKKPLGLIRYASARAIASKSGFAWTPRILGYSVLLVGLTVLLAVLLLTRTELDVTILRTPGMFYQEVSDSTVSNLYDVKVTNKTFGVVPLVLKLQAPRGELRVVGGDLTAQPQETVEGKVLVLLDRNQLKTMSTPVSIAVFHGATEVDVIETSFFGPPARQR